MAFDPETICRTKSKVSLSSFNNYALKDKILLQPCALSGGIPEINHALLGTMSFSSCAWSRLVGGLDYAL